MIPLPSTGDKSVWSLAFDFQARSLCCQLRQAAIENRDEIRNDDWLENPQSALGGKGEKREEEKRRL